MLLSLNGRKLLQNKRFWGFFKICLVVFEFVYNSLLTYPQICLPVLRCFFVFIFNLILFHIFALISFCFRLHRDRAITFPCLRFYLCFIFIFSFQLHHTNLRLRSLLLLLHLHLFDNFIIDFSLIRCCSTLIKLFQKLSEETMNGIM